MDARKAVILGQSFTVLAVVLVVSTRTGDTYGSTPRLFGVDSLLLAAVTVLLVSISIIVCALRMEN